MASVERAFEWQGQPSRLSTERVIMRLRMPQRTIYLEPLLALDSQLLLAESWEGDSFGTLIG